MTYTNYCYDQIMKAMLALLVSLTNITSLSHIFMQVKLDGYHNSLPHPSSGTVLLTSLVDHQPMLNLTI